MLVMEEGTHKAFGPRDKVLRNLVKNNAETVRTAGGRGVSRKWP